jgi:RNA polymerase sigma factor (sigma-70 family)
VAEVHESATDGELLNRYATLGEQAAFAELVRRHGALVLRVCTRILRDQSLAEDAFQATFLILAREASRIRRADRLANWLFGVATRVARTSRRQSLRRQRVEAAAGAPTDATAPPAESCDEWREILHEEIGRLPPHYRVAILLCDLEGRSRRDAARTLGVPDATLTNRLTRARAMLGRRLIHRGIVPGSAIGGFVVPRDLTAATVALVFSEHPPAAVSSLAVAACKTTIPLRALVVGLSVCMAMFLGFGKTEETSVAAGSATAAPVPPPRSLQPEPDPKPKPGNDVVAVEYSPDRKLLAVLETVRYRNEPQRLSTSVLTFLDASTYEVVKKLTQPDDLPESIQDIRFAPTAKLAYLICQEGAFYTLDLASCAVRKRFDADSGLLCHFSLSHDGKRFATYHLEAIVGRPRVGQMRQAVWDADTFRLIRDLQTAELQMDSKPLFSPDGKAIAVHYESKNGRGIVEFDPKTGVELRKTALSTVNPTATLVASPAVYSPDGKWLVMGGGEAVPMIQGGSHLVGYLRVWERNAGAVRTLGDGSSHDYFRTVALSPDGKRLFAGTKGANQHIENRVSWQVGEVHCWDTTTWKELWSVEIPGGTPTRLTVAPSGRRLWVADFKGLSMLDADNGMTRGRLIESQLNW